MSRNATLVIAVALSIVSFTAMAHAHAHLHSAVPAADSTIASVPAEIDLTFNEELNLKFTGIKVVGPDGTEVKVDSAMLMDGDKSFMAMLAGKPGPGTYQVFWHALSRDGHKTQGSYKFTVKP